MRHQADESPFPLDGASKTLFVDRDGVVNRLRKDDYVTTWEEFEFLPRVTEALRLLSQASYRVIVVTNQRGVARGRLSESELAAIHARMLKQVGLAGGRIAGVYYCPHEIGVCGCRKPEIGLFLEASRDFGDIDFRESAVIGDSPSDMEAARRLGCAGILVSETEGPNSAPTLYDAVVRFLVSS